MKHLNLFSVVFLFIAGLLSCASGEASRGTSSSAPVETSVAASVKPSSVWKISRNGNTMYLAGSVHLLREADFPLPEQFDRAFSLSDILVLEADVEEMADPEIAQYLAQQMILPGDETLQTILNPDTFGQLSQVCNEYGFSIDDVVKLKPSMVINILSVMQIQKYGFLQQGVDDYYLGKAKNENKPVNFLESAQSQIELIVNMGEGYENEYVIYSLQDMADTEDGLEILVSEWKNGEETIMKESLTEMKEEWPVIYKALITDRHDAWIPQLERFLASGNVYFVIAGVLHMHGSDGLLQRLENLGYTVRKF